jgi:hypothetical protein
MLGGFFLRLVFHAACFLIALDSTSLVQFRDAGVSKVGVKWFENKSHTDPILEDPLSGLCPFDIPTRVMVCVPLIPFHITTLHRRR